MKVLVATSRTQGARADDFFDGVEGELVLIPEPCEHGWRVGARGARCARGFFGLASEAGTTTAMVEELGWMTMRLYAALLRPCIAADVSDAMVWDDTCKLAAFALRWENGTVLERDLDRFRMRDLPALSMDRHGDISDR